MNHFLLLVIVLSGCDKESPITQVQPSETTFSAQASGQAALTNAHVMVIRNLLGGVMTVGEGRTDNSFRWYLYKTVSLKSSSDTAGLFSLINLSTTSNDTIYVDISSTTPYNIKTSCFVQLGIPYHLICKIVQVGGNTEISDLDSVLIIENASAVSVLRHNGSCQITSGIGNVSVENAIPDSGFCKIKVEDGNINLKVPANTSATVTAKTDNGTVSYSGLTFTNIQQQTKLLTGTLNSGAGKIQLETKYGNIQIQAIN